MKRLRIFLLFLLCVTVSFLVRTCAYNREAASVAIMIGDARPLWNGTFHADKTPAAAGWQDMLPLPRPNFVPYTVESAMMFAYASDLAKGKDVPERDDRLVYLKEIAPYAQMNMALEWVLGWEYRVLSLFRNPPSPAKSQLAFQDQPDFAWFVSWNVRLWTSLISGLLFLWLIVLKVPPNLALAGGLLHAVAAAAIARATGQDIVRGDFCIPLILSAMVLAQSLTLKPGRIRLFLLFLVVFAAFAAWDLCQMLFGFWALYEILRYLCGGRFTKARRTVWIVIAAAILLNAFLIPFNRTYGLIMSRLVCVVLPMLFLLMYLPPVKVWKRICAVLLTAGVLTGFYQIAIDNPVYRANYSHFSNTMKSKLKFTNRKPMDPSLLDYDSRIMWTPSMHSCTWEIAASYFPSIGSLPGMTAERGMISLCNLWNLAPLTASCFFFLLLLGGLITRIRLAILRDFPRNGMPYLFTIGFVIGFAYIVRYHEFLIIFLSLSFPLLIQEWHHGLGRAKKKSRRFLTGLFWFLILFELLVSTSARARGYATMDAYLPQTAHLIRWARMEHAFEGKTVVADFVLSPVLMAYTGAKIVMQPQFGMEPIRRPVEEYLNLMFHGTEESLADWCEKYQADFLVYDHGLTGPLHPYSSRYIANAAEIESGCPANQMQRAPFSMRRFAPVPIRMHGRSFSAKYLIFRFIRKSDMEFAEECEKKASFALGFDDLAAAKHWVRTGLSRDPKSPRLLKMHLTLFHRGYQPEIRSSELSRKRR